MDSGTNPYDVILAKLIGKDLNRPRCKTAVNVWRKTQRAEIEAELKNRLGDLKGKKNRLVTERDKIAREMFSRLSMEEQNHWKAVAVAEHNERMEAHKRELASPPSTAPADRQRSIQDLAHFAQPILDLISDATGLKVTLIMGGPEPARNEQLNTISLHSKITVEDIEKGVDNIDHERYNKVIMPIYEDFLKRCYTPEESRPPALSPDERPLVSAVAEQNENFSASSFAPSVPRPPDVGTSVLPFLDADPAPITPTIADNFNRPTVPTAVAVSPVPPAAPIPSPTVSMGTALADNNPFLFNSMQIRTPSPIHSPPRPQASPAFPHSRAFPPVPSRIQSAPPSPPASPHPRSSSPALSYVQSAAPSPQTGPAFHHPEVESSAALPAAGGGNTADIPTQNFITNSSGIESRSTQTATHTTDLDMGSVGVAEKRGTKRDQGVSTEDLELSDEEQTPKRRRTSLNAASSVPSTPMLLSAPGVNQPPNDAPQWFESALSMVQSANLGPEWVEMIRQWSAFEAKESHEEVAKLGTSHRPISVKDWIQRARSPTWRPTITNPSKYGQEFTKWWTSLQPKWRISGKGKIVFTATDGDWEVLRRPGLNGFLSIICCLFHWGTALQKNGKVVKNRDWIAAVQDCTTVFTCLLSQNA